MRGRAYLLFMLFVPAALLLLSAPPGAQAGAPIWSDDFDSYDTGVSLHGLGRWKGWNNDSSGTAFTSSAQARSPRNAMDVVNTTDLIHEYQVGAGLVHYRFYQYIPGNFQGRSYFIMLNQYDDGGPYNWSLQVSFNSATGLIMDDGTGATMAYVAGHWVEVCIEIDLDDDSQTFYYADTLFYSGNWSEHISGGGITAVGAVSLFANGATSIYYDDMSLGSGECFPPDEVDFTSYLPIITR